MATDPPGDLELAPLDGEPRTLDGWLTTFHLAAVILDPYTYESAWLPETAGRILDDFRGADCRIAFVVTADADDAREFLGPWAQRILTFADPDRDLVKALGLNELPAFVHPNDTAIGRLTAGCGAAGMTIAVTRDGRYGTAAHAPSQPAAAGGRGAAGAG